MMVGRISNNGDEWCYYDAYIGGGKHGMIWYKDIYEIVLSIKDKKGLLAKLLGGKVGTLVIRYKQFAYSKELKTVELNVESNEFDAVNKLVELVNSVMKERDEEAKRIAEARERRIEKIKEWREEFTKKLEDIPKVEIRLSDEKVLRQNAILSPYEKSATITKRSSIKNIKDFVVVDTETTGIKPGGNDIIEVSAIKFENFKPVLHFTTLLKPRKPIPTDATEINGITDEMVKDSPTFASIKSSLKEFIGNYPIVAHNASFDIKFLYVSGLDFDEKAKFYDTLELSKKHIKDYDNSYLSSYKLADVCEECNIFFDGAHRSSADALATGMLFIEIIKMVKEVYDIQELMNE